jgi:periplasmic protein TonB
MIREPYRSLLITTIIYLLFFTILLLVELDVNIFPIKKIETIELMFQSGNSVNTSNNTNPKPKTTNPNTENKIEKPLNSYPLASNFNTIPVNIPDTTQKDIDSSGSGYDSASMIDGEYGSVYGYGDSRLEEFPSFQGGGLEKFREWSTKNIRGNNLAMQHYMSGTMIVVFEIDRKGELTNISIEQGLNSDLDNAIVNIFKLSPYWKPGKQHGHPVPVQFKFPMVFK